MKCSSRGANGPSFLRLIVPTEKVKSVHPPPYRKEAQEAYEDALDFVREPSILASAASLYRPLRARKMAHEALAMRPWDDHLRTAAAMADLMAR